MRKNPALLCAVLTLAAACSQGGPAAQAQAVASPTIRGLFVGIDKYQFSTQNVGGAKFSDLRGAVADAQQIKTALSAAYGLDLDRPRPGNCKSSNAVSITLTDRCATWKAIINALNTQIAASKPGDTMIFYFAGHGSQLIDDQDFIQAPGFFSTILPTDARNPKGSSNGRGANDILDNDLNTIVQIANARGVNVVTIFDSCFSGSSTRTLLVGGDGEGESRGVQPLHLRPVSRQLTRLSATGPGGGYRVHLGASDDTEESREVSRDGKFNGVFTTALSQILVAMPHASFGDIATAARLKVLQSGQNRQHPQAEGALQQTLGGVRRSAALFDAEAQGTSATIAAGSLLGMTIGSQFALFDGDMAAINSSSIPLARGTITALDAYRATLALEAPLPTPAARLRARETVHSYGDQMLIVSVPDADTPEMANLVAALKTMPFVRIGGEGAQLRFFRARGTTHLSAMDSTGLANLGDDAAPEFPERLRTALLPIYNVQRLLALPTRTDSEAQISFCIAHDLTYDIRECPGSDGKQRRLQTNAPALLTIANMSETPRYIYHLMIDDRYGVTMIIPTAGGKDPKVEAGRAQRIVQQFDRAGVYRFITITSSDEINAKALEQPPLRVDYGGPCDPAIEKNARCNATGPQGSGGSDAGNAAQRGEWTITVDDAVVQWSKEPKP